MSRTRNLLGAVALGTIAWATLVEPKLFTIRRHTLPVLPAQATPVRVLQLSDLHLAPWHRGKIEWVRNLVQLKPDLIVLTGDLMGHQLARGPLMHALRPFAEAGIPGVFVHGSNDYYGPIAKNPLRYLRSPSRKSTRKPDLDNVALTRSLLRLGFTDVNNSAARLAVNGNVFEVFGLNDPHISYANPEKMRAAIEALGETAAETDGAAAAPDAPAIASGAPAAQKARPGRHADHAVTRLGVVHAPYQFALGALLDAGADVLLAGHTHGGQVRMPGVGALTTNCDLPLHLSRGLNVWFNADRAAFLNVSAGLGASIYAPIRFACRPEASLITLEAAQD